LAPTTKLSLRSKFLLNLIERSLKTKEVCAGKFHTTIRKVLIVLVLFRDMLCIEGTRKKLAVKAGFRMMTEKLSFGFCSGRASDNILYKDNISAGY